MQKQTRGRHIGECIDTAEPAEMQRLHALGYHTIDARTYRELIAAGIEPNEFTAMPDAQISTSIAAARACAREGVGANYCDLV